MATRTVAILGRGEFCKVVGEGLFLPDLSGYPYHYPVKWFLYQKIKIFLSWLLGSMNFSYPVCFGMSMGLFEITLGSRTITAANDPLLIKLLAVSIIMGFSGFSIIAQVMSIVAGLPVRLSFYLLSRFLQLTFSAIITWIGYTLVITPGQMVSSLAMPTYRILYAFDAWYVSLCSLVVGLLIIAVLMIISLLMQLPKTIRP
jgi:hypothetical protein